MSRLDPPQKVMDVARAADSIRQQQEIIDALAVLRYAQERYEHSPNSSTEKTVEEAREHFDELMDAMLTPEGAR